MKRGNWLIIVFWLTLVLTGCASNGAEQGAVAIPNDGKVLQAHGYSQFDDSGRLNVKQRWSSAQQSAKLNAYRSLAHQLYYESLPGNKTVGSQIIGDEVYRVYFDTYLRQARASDYRAVKDSLKTTVELKLTPRFYQCMGGDVVQANRCIQEEGKLPMTRLGYNAAETRTVNLACGTRDCSDQFYVKGFSNKRNAVDDVLLDYGFYDVEWTANMGLRILLNYLLINGFLNAF